LNNYSIVIMPGVYTDQDNYSGVPGTLYVKGYDGDVVFSVHQTPNLISGNLIFEGIQFLDGIDAEYNTTTANIIIKDCYISTYGSNMPLYLLLNSAIIENCNIVNNSATGPCIEMDSNYPSSSLVVRNSTITLSKTGSTGTNVVAGYTTSGSGVPVQNTWTNNTFQLLYNNTGTGNFAESAFYFDNSGATSGMDNTVISGNIFNISLTGTVPGFVVLPEVSSVPGHITTVFNNNFSGTGSSYTGSYFTYYQTAITGLAYGANTSDGTTTTASAIFTNNTNTFSPGATGTAGSGYIWF